MEFNVGELREKRRPLWMSAFDIENFADMLGGGGDINTDRLWPEWQRNYGEELNDEEAQEFSELHGISSKSEQPRQEAQVEAQAEAQAEAQVEAQSEAQSGSAGLGVGVNVDANVSGVTETVKDVAGTVTDTVDKVGKTATGLVGGLLGGKKKKK